jgi:classical protein kinase C
MRLGCGVGDATEVKQHPFFDDVCFEDVFEKKVEPPYVPTRKFDSDTSNFEEQYTSQTPRMTPVIGRLSPSAIAVFHGFSFPGLENT